jgi:hypothetical protein
VITSHQTLQQQPEKTGNNPAIPEATGRYKWLTINNNSENRYFLPQPEIFPKVKTKKRSRRQPASLFYKNVLFIA